MDTENREDWSNASSDILAAWSGTTPWGWAPTPFIARQHASQVRPVSVFISHAMMRDNSKVAFGFFFSGYEIMDKDLEGEKFRLYFPLTYTIYIYMFFI